MVFLTTETRRTLRITMQVHLSYIILSVSRCSQCRCGFFFLANSQLIKK